MGRSKLSGLKLRAGVWHIDKRIAGRRLCKSTGTSELAEAERYLARVMEQARQAQVYGVRPSRTFEEAAAKYVLENQHKHSILDDISRLNGVVPAIGAIPLDRIQMGSLQPWIASRRASGLTAGTINHGLQIVRHLLNLAAGEWVDDQGLTWLHAAPKIKLLPNTNKRQPYPLNWDEQERLFAELPGHLAAMARFAVNTGCRDREVCGLRWEWEVKVPELGASVFIIPGARVKNGQDRLVVLNGSALAVVEGRRGRHATHVFDFKGRPMTTMLSSAWRKARVRAGLDRLRVHDLKHTFGRRLRSAGVSFEDRQDLLGHRSGRMTTHYSAPELVRLVEAAERVSAQGGKQPELLVLRGAILSGSRKTHAKEGEAPVSSS